MVFLFQDAPNNKQERYYSRLNPGITLCLFLRLLQICMIVNSLLGFPLIHTAKKDSQYSVGEGVICLISLLLGWEKNERLGRGKR